MLFCLLGKILKLFVGDKSKKDLYYCNVMLVIDFVLDISQIVLADIVLSGDNALIIGMAAASFAEKDRKKIIFFGISSVVS